MKKFIFILIIIILGVFILLSYQNLQYEKALNEVRKTYNEEQCNIVGTTENYLYISRYFRDDKDYSDWKLTNIKTKKSYNFSLNKEGVGGLVGLKNGEYTLKEVSNHSYSGLDTNEYYLKFSENNKSYHFSPTSMNERAFVVLVLDKNDNPIPDIKINVLDSWGRVFLSSKTNEKGMIAFEHITADLCYIVQDGIDNPKKFFVKIEQDKVIGIKLHLNEEGVLE